MRLKLLRLKNFRNHHDSCIKFAEDINLIYGENGQGKTSILESISYLCLAKSFATGNEGYVLSMGSEFFEVAGEFESDYRVGRKIRLVYSPNDGGRNIWINGTNVDKLSVVIGQVPLVVLAPDDKEITSGAPAERRRFVDITISQANRSYFEDLVEFRRILKQRNKLLLDWRMSHSRIDSKLLDPWDESLIKTSGRIMYRRKQFVDEFQAFLQDAYCKLVDVQERAIVRYLVFLELDEGVWSPAEIEEELRTELRNKRVDELRRGTTLVGPHRDDFLFKINELDIKKYGSQGQHKTFLIALKAANYFYLREKCNETPIVLLDDVFSELDDNRSHRLMQFIPELGQTFITSTGLSPFDQAVVFENRNKKILVERGSAMHG
jgi:DNA replication and repair protein RecF